MFPKRHLWLGMLVLFQFKFKCTHKNLTKKSKKQFILQLLCILFVSYLVLLVDISFVRCCSLKQADRPTLILLLIFPVPLFGPNPPRIQGRFLPLCLILGFGFGLSVWTSIFLYW